MQFAFTDEQAQFRDVIRRFMEDKSSPREVRRLMATDAGFDSEIWSQLSNDLGLPGIHIPEVYGGLGFGLVELSICLEEMGRSLFCAPYFSSAVLAAGAILNVATEDEKQSLLPDIARGAVRASLAFTEPAGHWAPELVEMIAEPAGDSYLLSGTKSFVLDGMSAGLLIVLARLPGTLGCQGLSLFQVDPAANGLGVVPLQSVDQTRKLARIEFDKVQARLLGGEGDAYHGFSRLLDQASVALANEMVGGAQKMLDTAVAYTGQRMQFGRTIGSFQAIKHKCADLLLEVELAKSAAYYAAAAASEADFPAIASLAKNSSSDAFMHAAAECIQIHGGIGFTWDHDTHLWYKRAKSSEVFLGDPAYHRELMMQRWHGAGDTRVE